MVLIIDDPDAGTGTFTLTNLSLGAGAPVGPITGTLKMAAVSSPQPDSPGQQIKNVMTQEIIETTPASSWAAALGAGIPFVTVMLAVVIAAQGNTGFARGIVLGLSCVAGFCAIILGFSLASKRRAGLVTFFLGLFAGMTTVLLVVAKIFELPGT